MDCCPADGVVVKCRGCRQRGDEVGRPGGAVMRGPEIWVLKTRGPIYCVLAEGGVGVAKDDEGLEAGYTRKGRENLCNEACHDSAENSWWYVFKDLYFVIVDPRTTNCVSL